MLDFILKYVNGIKQCFNKKKNLIFSVVTVCTILSKSKKHLLKKTNFQLLKFKIQNLNLKTSTLHCLNKRVLYTKLIFKKPSVSIL